MQPTCVPARISSWPQPNSYDSNHPRSGGAAEVLALKHESGILGQWSNPVSGSGKSQASSLWLEMCTTGNTNVYYRKYERERLLIITGALPIRIFCSTHFQKLVVLPRKSV